MSSPLLADKDIFTWKWNIFRFGKMDICKAVPGTEVDVGCTDNRRVCEELYGPEWDVTTYERQDICGSVPFVSCKKRDYTAKETDCCLSADGCPNGLSCQPGLFLGSLTCSQFTESVCSTPESWQNNREYCGKAFVISSPQTRSFIFSGIFRDGIRPPGTRIVAQQDLYAICHEFPSLCGESLFGLCSRYTLDGVKTNRNIAELCGCYLSNADIYEYSAYGVSRECIPACTSAMAVKLADRPCLSGLCIIDDVTISLNRSVGGNVNISQVCTNCSGSATCRCDIHNVNIDISDSEFNDINLSQQCVGNARCVDGRTGQEIPCTSESNSETERREATTSEIVIASMTFGMTALIVCVLAAFLIRNVVDKS